MPEQQNQATKKCPHCQSDIALKAKKCPNCQTDLRSWPARHPILTIIGVLVVLGIIGAVVGSEGGNSSAPTAGNQQQAQEATQVDAASFIAEFDANQLAAEEKYKGKLVEFVARIDNISEDILGTPFLSLNPPGADKYYLGTTIKCSFDNKSALTSLQNGQLVALHGVVDTQSLGIIDIKNCRVVATQ